MERGIEAAESGVLSQTGITFQQQRAVTPPSPALFTNFESAMHHRESKSKTLHYVPEATGTKTRKRQKLHLLRNKSEWNIGICRVEFLIH